MPPFIKTLFFLFVFSSSPFALSPFEKALLADEKGEVDQVIDYLFEALDEPGNQELEIRYLLHDYLVLLGNSKWIEQNQGIINQLKAIENANNFNDDTTLNSSYNPSPWSQSLSLNNNYSMVSFDGQEQGLYNQTYYPEIGYSIDYYRYAYNLHHSLSFSINYEQSLFYSSYSLKTNNNANSQSIYKKDIIYYDSLNEYTLSSQLSYFLYDSNWYLNAGLETFQSEYYDLSLGVFSYLGFTPLEGEFGKLGLNFGASFQQEFGSEYSLGAKYSKNFFNHSLALNLGYTFSIAQADSYQGPSIVAIRSTPDSLDVNGINTEQLNWGLYDIKQENFTHQLMFQAKIKPTNTLSLTSDCIYSISQNFESDIWYSPNSIVYTKTEQDSILINRTQIYQEDLIYRANTTSDLSESQSIILNQDLLTHIKLKLKGSLKWEFIQNQFLIFSYTEYFQRSLGKDTDLAMHPYYNQDLENSIYLNLEYLVEF